MTEVNIYQFGQACFLHDMLVNMLKQPVCLLSFCSPADEDAPDSRLIRCWSFSPRVFFCIPLSSLTPSSHPSYISPVSLLPSSHLPPSPLPFALCLCHHFLINVSCQHITLTLFTHSQIFFVSIISFSSAIFTPLYCFYFPLLHSYPFHLSTLPAFCF